MKHRKTWKTIRALSLLLVFTAACGDDDYPLMVDKDWPDMSQEYDGDSERGPTQGEDSQIELGTPPELNDSDDPDDPLDPDHPTDPSNPTDPTTPSDPTDPATPPDEPKPPDPDPPATPPRGPAQLRVYTANVENLPRTSDGCQGDWKDLFAYMQLQPNKPDILLVQQVTNLAQLGTITSYMTSKFGRTYAGLIAENDPVPFNSPCGAQKEKQTNAIIYATDRLQPIGTPTVWKSYKNVNGSCVRDGLSRTRGIASGFRDLATREAVSVASIHWSTRNGSGADPACASANAADTHAVLTAQVPIASLFIFGGDTNEPDLTSHTASSGYNTWYTQINGELGGALGYRDPVFRECSDASLRACLLNKWTFRGANADRRIDFLFMRTATGYPELIDAHTVTFNQGDAADLQLTGTDNGAVGYSDHRSVWAQIRY